jgi:hypothetical protein
MASRPVHKLVTELAAGLKPPKVPKNSLPAGSAAPTVPTSDLPAGSAEALAYASNLPDAIMFTGFLGALVEEPGGRNWQVLYVDFELDNCLLVDDGGILANSDFQDDAVPFTQRRDVIWVKADAAVGLGRASNSVEAQFLTGDFTRAGDFEAPPSGGTVAAATGIFCQARTASCCYGSRSRR